MASFTEIVSLELAKMLIPLQQLEDGKSLLALLRDLGFDFEEEYKATLDLEGLVGCIGKIIETIELLPYKKTDKESKALLKKLSKDVVATVKQLKDDIPRIIELIENLPNRGGELEDIPKVLPRRLFDWLLYTYLVMHRQQVFAVLHLLGIAEIEDLGHASIKRIQWDRIPLLFSPIGLAEEVYGWNKDTLDPNSVEFEGETFIVRVELLMKAFLLTGGLYLQNEQVRNALGRSEDSKELRIPLYQTGQWQEQGGQEKNYSEFGLNISPLPKIINESNKTIDRSSGLAFYPYFYGGLELEGALGNDWTIQFQGNKELFGKIGLLFRAPNTISLKKDFLTNSSNQVDSLIAEQLWLELALRRATAQDNLIYIFGDKDTSSLSFREIGFNLILNTLAQEQEVAAELEILDLCLKLQAEKGDGLLKEVLNGFDIETACSLAIGYSNIRGLYLRGSGGLQRTIPVHKKIGPILLNSFFLSIGTTKNIETNSDDLKASLKVSFGAMLGPVALTVQNTGLDILLSLPQDEEGNASPSGNLGPLHINTPNFASPDGVRIAVNASGITGSGGLHFDPDNHRYTGDLILNFSDFALTAIGLITTQLPDGSDNFALLISINALFNPPLQLSMGFTLTGVGGLIGVNRSIDVDTLRTRFRNRALNSILFPPAETFLENADTIISDLRSVFPPTDGQYVVGPVVQINWGRQNLITAEVGFFVEFPEPIRTLLIGQVTTTLPIASKALLVANLDVLGVVDFAKKEITFQASLYKSRLLEFEMFGDAAFLLSWGDNPRFILSMGGFHPKFPTPEPAIIFADMRRLTLRISRGKDLQLTCEAYLAITSNSVQFGAGVLLYAKKGNFSARGYLGFDALFYLSPFSFEVEMRAGIRIKYKSYTLFGLTLIFVLAGPTPWVARGKARISLFFFSISVGFKFVWGSRRPAMLPAIDPWVRGTEHSLLDALLDSSNWNSLLPPGQAIAVALRSTENELTATPVNDSEDHSNENSEPPLVLHPAGRLEIRQNLLPLGFELERIGVAPIQGHNCFEISRLSICTNPAEHKDSDAGSEETVNPCDVNLTTQHIEDYFPRGQYEKLTEDERLSLPAFEKFPCGVTTARTDELEFSEDTFEIQSAQYKNKVITEDTTVEDLKVADEDKHVTWQDAQSVIRARRDRRIQQRLGPNHRFSPRQPSSKLQAKPKIQIKGPTYSLVNAETLQAAPSGPKQGLTRMAADHLLKQKRRLSTPEEFDNAKNLMVVPSYQLRK
jgi:hypothetical protein